jgi:hypothetical protein
MENNFLKMENQELLEQIGGMEMEIIETLSQKEIMETIIEPSEDSLNNENKSKENKYNVIFPEKPIYHNTPPPNINFIVGSITFLQLYIPLIRIYREHRYPVRLILRENKTKSYANPLSLRNHFIEIVNKYQLTEIIGDETWIEEGGLTYCVDGDIYGNKNSNFLESYLIKHFKDLDNEIRKKHTIISLVENTNFVWVYHKYIDLVDYVIFHHADYVQGYYHYRLENFVPINDIEKNVFKDDQVAGYLYQQMLSSKNLFLGNPKFDFKNYRRYGLPENDENGNRIKYALLFHPEYRFSIGQNYYGHDEFNTFYDNMLLWLKDLGYTLIVKDRNKSTKITSGSGSVDNADTYISTMGVFPNPSLELLALSDLAIFFSSSVIEEVVYYKVPFIEVVIDDIYRFDFYRDNRYGYIIKDRLPDEGVFKQKIQNFEKKKKRGLLQQYYDEKHSIYFSDKYQNSGTIINPASRKIFQTFH